MRELRGFERTHNACAPAARTAAAAAITAGLINKVSCSHKGERIGVFARDD